MNFPRAQTQRGAGDVHQLLHGHVTFRVGEPVRKQGFAQRVEGLGLLLAERRARDVNRHVASADHHHAAADGKAVAEVGVEQEIRAGDDAVEIAPRKHQFAAAVQADGQQNGLEPFRAQVFQGKVTQAAVEAQVRPQGENLANLRLHHVAGQAVFRNPQVQHATGHRGGFKNGDGITPQSEVVRGRKARGPGTDHRHALRVSHAGLLRCGDPRGCAIPARGAP